MNDLERRMILKIDDAFRFGTFRGMLEKGIEKDVAADSVNKTYPLLGNPEDTSNASGDDRPICYELKNRINIYVCNRSEHDPEMFKSQLKNFRLSTPLYVTNYHVRKFRIIIVWRIP